MHQLILLFGSNLGDRLSNIHQATQQCMIEIGEIKSQSSIYETAPWGMTEQQSFYNQVIEFSTIVDPQQVLVKILAIEEKLGRVRNEKWGARIIDIDILYYDDVVIESENLKIPHPYLHERRFTLAPLVEILPTFMHPSMHQTNEVLMMNCTDQSVVNIL
jgi:2-amino-4-hydroxy-6-hydroxymethyldihydropteridine diphosphokinase